MVKILWKDAATCLMIFCVFLLVFSWLDPTKKPAGTEGVDISYLEDGAGELTLDDVKNAFEQGQFIEKDNGVFSFGKSSSVYWIRIQAQNADALKDYLSLYSPNVEDVRLYIGDTVHISGWGNILHKSDDGLTYPVFSLAEYSSDVLAGPIYLRIASSYIHDYTINFYTQSEFTAHRNADLCINCLLFGVLLTIFATNMFIFFRMKSKLCLTFALSVLFLSIHLGCFTGIYNLFPSRFSGTLMSLSIEFSYLYLAAILWFFLVVSDVKTFRRAYYHVLLVLLAANVPGLLLCLMDKIAANTFSYLLSALVVLAGLYFALRIHLAGHANLRLYLAGWSFALFMCIVSVLRSEGLLFNNFVVIQTSFFGMVATYILFSIGVAEYTNRIQIQKAEAERQYRQAAEQVKRVETALLQTQIKPHFLYNTLASIERLCAVDAEKAGCAIADFADYLRGNIDFSMETGLIRIEKEMENVKHYLALEQMRFAERLQVIYDVRVGGFMLPPLVVQPMVENAVRHGVTKKPDGGTVCIAVTESETDYVITVEDDGVGFDPGQLASTGRPHIGIENARSRLSRQSRGVLKVVSESGKGTTVIITIPKERCADEYGRG